MKPYRKQLYN